MPEHVPIVLDFDAEKRLDAIEALYASEKEVAQDLMYKTAKGVALLDRLRPDWWRAVWLDRLDANSLRNDVLGQVYGDYFTGCRALCDQLPKDFLFTASEFGFTLAPKLQDHQGCTPGKCLAVPRWDALTEWWIFHIRARSVEASKR